MPLLTEDDRRQHPRRTCTYPLALETPDGAPIPCETVDVSMGGMRVLSSTRVPLGEYDVVISAGEGGTLALRAEVLEELIDVSTGEVTARIVFLSAPLDARERVVALAHEPLDAPRSRRRTLIVAAVATVSAMVIAGGAYALTRDGGEGARTAEMSPVDAQPAARAAAPRAPVVTDAPVPEPAPAPRRPVAGVAAPAEPAPDGRPARVERADNITTVVLGSSEEDTSVQSTVGPSPEGDDVRMQLYVTPEPDGTTLPVAVTIENRGDETLSFPDGVRATVTASREGSPDAATTLTSDVVALAPGQSVTVEGFLDFRAPGEYDVTATAEVG